MLDTFERLAGTEIAIWATWIFALMVFAIWLIIEVRGVVFTSLIRWKPLILKSLRTAFAISLILPLALALFSGFAGPWAILVIFPGMSCLPPSIYILGTSVGVLYSIYRTERPMSDRESKIAYTAFAILAIIGCATFYVSLVWLDKPV